MLAKKTIRETFANFQEKYGLIKISSAPFVLLYHRVLNDPLSEIVPVQPGMYVTTKTFDEHIRFLKKSYNIIPLCDLLDMIFNGKGNINNCCSITFDDGWVDNYYNAFQLLRKHQVPASFFLATAFIGTDLRFWSEEVSCFLYHSHFNAKREIAELYDIPYELKRDLLSSKLPHENKITKVVKYMKDIDKGIRDNIIRQMTHFNKTYIDKFQRVMMDWEQIKEMYKSGFCKFYPHSHSHEILTYMEVNKIEEEIHKSISSIQENIQGGYVHIFSYPSGRYDEKVVNSLIKNNVKYSMGTQKGYLLSSKSPFDINRIGIHDDISYTTPLFKLCLK